MRALAATPPTRRTGRTLGAALAASALLVGASACASESDSRLADVQTDAVEPGDFRVTANYLQQAAEQSTAEGYRVEVLLSLSDEVSDDTPPLMTGEVGGDRFHYVMDMGSMIDQMAGALGGAVPDDLGIDLSVEMAGDPEALYLRAPIFARLGDLSAGGAEADLAALGDGWGYVDIAALGEQLPGDLASAMGGQGVDPQAVVEMVQSAEDVQDLGSDEVRGTAVHGLSAEVTMADLLEASGQDPEALAEAGSVGGDDSIAALYETMTPIEVWIDGDGYVRRTTFSYDMGDIASAMGEEVDDLAEFGYADLQFSYAIDMFDYGTVVDFDAPDDAVDITDAFGALVRG
jgi:hypothetical protein